MKNPRTFWVLIAIASVVVLVCVAVPAWWLIERNGSWYSDGDRIRVPAAKAPIRDILWQPAEQVARSDQNTDDEYEPRLSADGTLMVLVRGRPGHNADLFTCRWTPHGWSTPEPIAEINTAADELGPELSRDGKSLYFYSDRGGGQGGYDLWQSQSVGTAWSLPVNLGPNVNTEFNEYGPALTPDGRTLYFASNRARPSERVRDRDPWAATVREQRGRHDYDLYLAPLASDGPALAQPVLELNTTSDEGAPTISPVGDFLYFASDRPGGLGGFDLYRCRLSRGQYSSIENLGNAINSPANDLDPALAADGFRLYFSTNRAGTKAPASAVAATPSAASPVRSPAAPYSLWTSGSREVFRESDRRASARVLADTVGVIWPWLLMILLAAAFAALVWYVSGNEAWQARYRRLSLFAKCVVVSLAIHLVLASLLAVWRVGSSVGEFLRKGGGTRVVLASSGSLSGVVQQVRGNSIAPLQLPDITIPRTQPALHAVALATPKFLNSTPTAGSHDSSASLPLPDLSHDVTPRATTPVPNVTPAQLPPSTTAIPREQAKTPIVSERGATLPTSQPVATASRSRPITAPVVIDARVELPTAGNAPTTAMPSPLIETAVEAAPSVASLGTNTIPTLALPQRAVIESVKEPSTRREQLAQGVSESALDPLATANRGISPMERALSPAPVLQRVGTFVIAPSSPSRPTSDLSLSPLVDASVSTESAMDSALSSLPPDPRIDLVPAPQASSHLPAVPAEAQPVEDFAQRSPELRNEMLARMGGSVESERAVGLALEWFQRHQHRDGHWSARGFDDACHACGGEAQIDGDSAMTGIVLLCYLSAGHTHLAEGPYQQTVRRGITWILDRQSGNGDLRHGETMYGHTIATVAMCEAFAMTRDGALEGPTQRAVAFLSAPRSGDQSARNDNTSVLGWQVMAIASARRSGMKTPETSLNSARKWLDTVSGSRSPGRYAYRPGDAPNAAMTAEAAFVQQLLGHARTEPRMQESAEFILATPPRWRDGAPTYYWYYATLAMFEQQGEAWTRWNNAIVGELTAHQHQDGPAAGSWDPQDEWSKLGGRVYQTAVCTLSLEVYYRYRPTGVEIPADVRARAGPSPAR